MAKEYFDKNLFHEAHENYLQALDYCTKFVIAGNELMTEAHINCAMACLKLHMYRDAYDHSTKSLRFDPSNYMVTTSIN